MKLPKVELEGYVVSFSEDLFARSLLKIGLHVLDVYKVMELVFDEIKDKVVVSTEDLFQITLDILKSEIGKRYAERYETWHKYNVLRRKNIVEPLIILVGGVSAVGKTVTVTSLSYRLTISRVITTDSIRRIAKVLLSEEELKIIHVPSYKAWQILKSSEENLNKVKVKGFLKQAEILKPTIIDLITKSIRDKKDLAIEGVHITPKMLPENLKNRKNVLQVLISAPKDKELYKHMFLSKRRREGVEDTKNLLADVETCLEINEYLIKEAKEDDIYVIESGNFERMLDEMLELVYLKVKSIVDENEI